MLLDPTPDQDSFRQTTAKYLDVASPRSELRQRRDDPDGHSRDYWSVGADLGWLSLLVSEEGGGGTISGQGLVDLTLIAHEFGRHAAPGPLASSNVVAEALSAEANGHHSDVLSSLQSGASLATWCYEEPRPSDALEISLAVGVDGDFVVLNGLKRPVESAAAADYMLVTGRTGAGLTQVLVPHEAAGLSVKPMSTVDLSRRFGVVTFDQVRLPIDHVVGEIGSAAAQVERQLQIALVILNAESVGAMESAFEMTMQWVFDRYSFGRPLASYQALKHRLADMKSWLEAGHAIGDEAAQAVQTRSPDANELVSVAKAFIGDYGAELLQECVQMHGGIGLTFDHDLHLFLRRVTLNRALFGTPAVHRQRIAAIRERDERAA